MKNGCCTENVQQPFFVDHSVIPTHQIGQGEGLIRAVGVCGAVGGGGCLFHSPHDLADGGAVLGQVGLAAARVGEQDLAQMANHQRQRQQLGGFGVVVVTGISGGLVDLLGRKAPAQQAAGLLYAQVAVQYAGAVAGKGKSEPWVALATACAEERTTQTSRAPLSWDSVFR